MSCPTNEMINYYMDKTIVENLSQASDGVKSVAFGYKQCTDYWRDSVEVYKY